ncbi:MAG: hypothetical protein EXS05_20145 [Planctomycetaceae bacterium]|nr:hypothetical protein [Planctomycetaceae bacterium]
MSITRPSCGAARWRNAGLVVIGFVLCSHASQWGFGDDPDPAGKPGDAATKEKEALVPVSKNGNVLLDKKGGRVLLKTRVALREGTLEQLCCRRQTKEHESILSLDAPAFVVHTALLALKSKPGKPAQFKDTYEPPQGQTIEIFLNWTDDKGKAHRVPAKDWVRHSIHRFWSAKLEKLPEGVTIPKNTELRYDNKLHELSWYGPMTEEQKDEFLMLSRDKDFRKAIDYFYEQGQSRAMKADWVFVGSGFYTDEETGKKHYLAEDGDLICVANFPGAMIDVSVESSSQGDGLLFEAYTERIPPKETPVTVELIPVFEEADKQPANSTKK